MRGASLEARLAWLGILTALVDLGSAYVKLPIAPRGLTVGDAIHILGIFPLLGLYAWIALDLRGRDAALPAWTTWVLFLAGVTYALGFGIHVAANSIHDMLDHVGLGDPWGLAYFWDERVGHYPVDASRAALAVALTTHEERGGGAWTAGAKRMPLVLGALAYGLIYFATAVEGQTVPLALPFSAAFAAWSLARRSRRAGPVRGFYTVAAIASLILFAVWGFWKGGFPEFSKTGFL